MKVVVLGGAGLMGRVIARTLVERLGDEVVVADYNLQGAKQVVDWIGSPKASASAVDVTDEGMLAALLQDADAAANAVTYYHNLRIMDACLRAKVPYVDLGGLASGRLNRPGVHAPEAVVEPKPLFEELGKLGLESTVSIERPLKRQS
jgi:NAD(P)-dependent dehydrogenase (short-subunit alcohol dehydrogenase family)